MKKTSFRRLAVIAAAALVAASTFTSGIYADVSRTPLLDLKVDWPQILFDNTGQTNYVAAEQLLKIEADALFLQFMENDFPYSIVEDPGPFGIFKIRARVDHTGKFVGGIPPGDPNDACGGGNGDDFCVRGTVPDPFDATAPPIFAGVLLSGEVLNFASREGGIGPDDFEFHVKITGGALEEWYSTDHLVVPVSSEVRPAAPGPDRLFGTADDLPAPTPFVGIDSFKADFGGGAIGTAGATDIFVEPLPPADPTTCQEIGATNYGELLPCTYAPVDPPCTTDCPPDDPLPTCQEEGAPNYGLEGPCLPPLPDEEPPPTCDDQNAMNYLGALPCTYPPPPVVSGTGATVEATGPDGALVILNVTSTGLSVSCESDSALGTVFDPAAGMVFPKGEWTVVCTSANSDGLTSSLPLVVIVEDTTPPQIDYDLEGYTRPATGPGGALVNLPVTATDIYDPSVAVTCDPASGSLFPIDTTQVMCSATDAAGNLATPVVFSVTVFVAPPSLPDGACFIVDFREVAYFKDTSVITTWPYNPAGIPGTTKSRGTLYRIYGIQPGEGESGQTIPSADFSWVNYVVKKDNDRDGYYIDLGGPGRPVICANQLQDDVLTDKKGNGHRDGSTLLPMPQRNVPGIMLTHNRQIVKLPTHVRSEMYRLGLSLDPGDPRGLIDYIGFQHQGNGNAHYREFVDVQVQFLNDSDGKSVEDRLQHYKFGFHTALNVTFETFAGCSYLDYAPGNDAVRLHNVWGPNRSRYQGYASWEACGSREPLGNQRLRAQYIVPYNAVQILSTVNTGTDTLNLFYGDIRPIPAKEKNKKDHKKDWEEWDRWDH